MAQERTTAKRRAWIGPSLIAVCLLHCLLGVVGGMAVWTQAARAGWIGAFSGAERQAVLWFMLTGLVGIVAGVCVTHVERHRRLPWSVTISLIIVAVFGVLAAPASGFWLVLVVGLLAAARSAGWGTRSSPERQKSREVTKRS